MFRSCARDIYMTGNRPSPNSMPNPISTELSKPTPGPSLVYKIRAYATVIHCRVINYRSKTSLASCTPQPSQAVATTAVFPFLVSAGERESVALAEPPSLKHALIWCARSYSSISFRRHTACSWLLIVILVLVKPMPPSKPKNIGGVHHPRP